MSQQYTYTTGNQGIMLVPTESDRVSTPRGLLISRAVETKDGWVGQIIVDKTIIWETDPRTGEKDAVNEATERVVRRLTWLFADDTEGVPIETEVSVPLDYVTGPEEQED